MKIQTFTFNPFQENTYILYDEETLEGMIVDPGCFNTEEETQISQFIQTHNIKPTLLVNTHCHIDHIMGNGYISGKYQLPLHLHKKEEETMQHSSGWGKMYGLEIDIQPTDRIYIDETNTLTLGKYTFDILYTPGHSIASLSFYCRQAQILISGDVLFRQGIGRYDLPGGDFEVLKNSILTQLYTLPNEVKVFSGHGEPTTIGFEKVNNPYVNVLL